jgi:uncharacterized protein (DUF2062 family)
MRKRIRSLLPDLEKIRGNRWLAFFGDALTHPRLWHLNRHSAAGGVAVGLFCGLIPGPLQMLGAALACVVLRVNLPLALVSTLYTNPLTIVPLYVVAFGIGNLVLGGNGGYEFVAPPAWVEQAFPAWLGELIDWMAGLGKPLFVGLLLLASLLSFTGYFAVRGAWRWYLVRAWRSRKARA